MRSCTTIASNRGRFSNASRTRLPPINVPRFFVEGVHAAGELVGLQRDDGRKLVLVLRKRAGDALEICDSAGTSFAATLVLEGERAQARLDRELGSLEAPLLEITLAQALPKAAKMDYVIEKATELGVARIVPLMTERTLVEVQPAKVERWRRIARSASQQCGRRDVPDVEEPLEWAAFCQRIQTFDRVLVPWELAAHQPLHQVLPEMLLGRHRIAVTIGPEGGLSEGEVQSATAAGAVAISLGSRILRTETAGLVACSVLLYASGTL